MFGKDIEIRARQAPSSTMKPEKLPAASVNLAVESPVEHQTFGELSFQRERHSLRAHKVIEQAWLIFQYMKNNTKRSVRDDDLTPNELQTLLKSLQGSQFGVISNIMEQSKVSRLQNDVDASLTANSLLNYTMLIK